MLYRYGHRRVGSGKGQDKGRWLDSNIRVTQSSWVGGLRWVWPSLLSAKGIGAPPVCILLKMASTYIMPSCLTVSRSSSWGVMSGNTQTSIALAENIRGWFYSHSACRSKSQRDHVNHSRVKSVPHPWKQYQWAKGVDIF